MAKLPASAKRRARPKALHPLAEGHINLIFKRFILPLTRYKPVTMDLKAWWEALFHVDERDIRRYLVTKAFQMPGLLCTAPLMKVQGVGYRQVGAGQTIWARTDSTTPNEIDIEWVGSGKQQLFSLSASEWGWTLLHLEDAEKRRSS